MGKLEKMVKEAGIILRVRKFIDNRLLCRKQMVLDVFHSGCGNLTIDNICEKVAAKFKANKEQVSIFGIKHSFGGGKTSGFCLIYDNVDALKKYEPTFRLRRKNLVPEKDASMTRKIKKELKIKRKKCRGTAKAKVQAGKKKINKINLNGLIIYSGKRCWIF